MNPCVYRSLFLIRNTCASPCGRIPSDRGVLGSSLNSIGAIGNHCGILFHGQSRESHHPSHSPQNIKKDRVDEVKKLAKSHEKMSEPPMERKRFAKHIHIPDDGTVQVEFQEEIVLSSSTPVARKTTRSDVPQEVVDKLSDVTVDFIKKQSFMSGGASS